MQPKRFFFMVNMASGTARERVLSPTTMMQPCKLGKVSHQFNDIGHSFQLTAVKTRNLLTSIT